MISAGSETRFPADRPNIAQAIKRTAAFVVCVIANSAPAWLNSDSAVTRRRSRRNTDTPSARRPTIAMAVSRATVNPAWVRPIAGSRKEIWCTKKPTWAISARANGPATLQKCEAPQRRRTRPTRRRGGRARSRSRSAVRKENACRFGAYRRPVDTHRDGWDENRCHNGCCTDHGGCEAGRGNCDDEGRRDENAARARAIERQADREPALAVEPQAQHVGDRSDVHRRRPRRHDQIG